MLGDSGVGGQGGRGASLLLFSSPSGAYALSVSSGCARFYDLVNML